MCLWVSNLQTFFRISSAVILEWQTRRWEDTSRPSIGLWEGESLENLPLLHFLNLYDGQESFGYHTPFQATPLHSQDIFISATEPFVYLPPHHCLPFYFSACLSLYSTDGTGRIGCLISMYVAQGQTCHLWSQLPAGSVTLLSCYSVPYHRILLGCILKHISLSATFDVLTLLLKTDEARETHLALNVETSVVQMVHLLLLFFWHDYQPA